MNFHRKCIGGLAILLACMAGFVTALHAAEDREMSSGVPLPVIPSGQGDTCVEDVDYMRRNHMDMLKHQRDDTMLKGIRGEPYSLAECISCHAVMGPDATAVTVASPKHFCRSCHDYAAVSIDCFQCHASRPETAVPVADHPFQIASPTPSSPTGQQQP